MFVLADICWPGTYFYGNHVVAVVMIALGLVVEGMAYAIAMMFPFGFILGPALINGVLESAVLKYGCHLPVTRKIFWQVCGFNLVSVAMSFTAFLVPDSK